MLISYIAYFSNMSYNILYISKTQFEAYLILGLAQDQPVDFPKQLC